jgi:hypothetical protein
MVCRRQLLRGSTVVASTIAFCLFSAEARANEPKGASALIAAPAPVPSARAAAAAPSKAPAPAEASGKPTRIASLTATKEPAPSAPPKEPAAKPAAAPAPAPVAVAPKPPAAPKPPPAWSPSPSPGSANACAAVSELRTELKEALDGEAHALSPEQRQEKDGLEAEAAKERATYKALLTAVEKGVLERSTLAEAIERSEKRLGELTGKANAIKPMRGRGLLAMPERLDALAISLQSIEARLAQQTPSDGAISGPPPPPPPAADVPASSEPPAAAAESKAVGLNVDAGVAGLYAFRGLNVFKAGSQLDQNALFAPSITYNPTFLDGLTVGYWGAYQLTGDNASQLVKAGIGNEQDLTASYGRYVVKEKVQARAGITNYVYPFAERAVAGAKTPYFFEPWAQATYEGPVTASLLGTYFYGTQDAMRPLSYVYVHPAVEKTFTVNKTIGFVPGAGLGYKAFTHNPALSDNRWEITGDVKLPIVSSLSSYVTPGAHYAWSNFAPGVVGSAHAVWLSMNVGLNL